MAKTDYRSVDAYLAAQPAEVRAVLKEVRAAIRKALPKATEVISYQIPAYKLPGGTVIYFAGWKQHFSLYPVNRALLAELGDAVAAYKVNDKGTMRIPLSEPVPAKLIGRIAKLLAKAVAERKISAAAKVTGRATTRRSR